MNVLLKFFKYLNKWQGHHFCHDGTCDISIHENESNFPSRNYRRYLIQIECCYTAMS